MSDKARDEITNVIWEAALAFEEHWSRRDGLGWPPSSMDYADQIIALIRKEGYIHPDDLAEGMVHFVCDFPGDLPITKEHCPAEEYKATRQLSGKWRWDSCKNYPCQYLSTRPATVRECLAGLAVKG